MANDIKVKLDLDGSSVSRTTKEAQKLRAELEAAAKAAGNINTNKSAGSTKAYQSAMQGASSTAENVEYGIARSMGAGTGAAGRDFAKQAQGLGGLVHVYATFAANLFAVSAAFTALKNAADTTNMIKGLDQLGAASGRGLGSLSKEIVKLTDGAVTLREAMEATAKATAAGMSNMDLKRLAVGAKNASQALGVDMSDALSRLSRGITKLEPELLDELGIFVRVDKAASDYARTLGKPASALTDFEKRAAFAAATLDQVEKKFGNIKLDANPYNQLLASLKEVLQTGLETINTFLEPVLRLLAASPTGLAVALAGVGAVLLKQAIPALGSLKESMRAASEQATNIANIKAVAAIDAKRAALKEKELQIENKIDAEINKVIAAEEKLGQLRGANLNKNTAAYKLLQKTMEVGAVYTPEDFDRVEKAAKRAAAAGDMDKAAVYREISTAVQGTIEAENNLAEAKQKHTKEIMSQASATSTLGMVQRIADKANQDATKRQIVSSAAYNASIEGFGAAIKKLHAEIQQARQASSRDIQIGTGVFDEQGKEITKVEKIAVKGLGNIKTATTYVSGAFAAATGAIGTFMNAFGTWFAFAGLVAAGIGILVDHLSETAKESKATAEGFENIKASAENAERVLLRIQEINPLEKITIETTKAKATALNEVATSLATGVSRAFNELDKMGTVDRWVNNLKSIIQSDVTDNLSDNLSVGISAAFRLAGNSAASVEAAAKLRNILGKSIDVTNIDANIFEKLADSGKLGKSIILEVVKIISELNSKTNESSSIISDFATALEKTDKSAQELKTSLMPTDKMSKFGEDLMAQAFAFDKAMQDPEKRLLAIKALLSSPANLAILDSQEISSSASELLGLIDSFNMYSVSISEAENKLKDLNKQEKELSKNKGASAPFDAQKLAFDKQKIQKELEDAVQGKITVSAQIDAKVAAVGLEDAGTKMFSAGAEKFSLSLAAELQKGAAAFSSAVAGTISGTKLAIDTTTSAANAQLESEKNIILSQGKLVQATYELKLATELETASREKARLEDKTSKSDEDKSKLATLEKTISQLEKDKQLYTTKVKVSEDVGVTQASKTDTLAARKSELEYLRSNGASLELIQQKQAVYAMQVALTNKGIQQAGNLYAANIQKQEVATKEKIADNNLTKEKNTQLLSQLDTIQAINGTLAPQLLSTKQAIELSNLELENKNKVLAAQQDLNTYTAARKALGQENNTQYDKEQGSIEKALQTAKETQQITEASLKLKQAGATAENEINIQRELLSIEQQKLDALASIGVAISANTIMEQGAEQARLLELEHLTRKKNLQDQIDAAQANNQTALASGLSAQLQYEDQLYEKRKQSLDITTQIKAAQADIAQITNSFNAVFDQLNGAAGAFADSLMKAQAISEVYGKELKNNTEAQKKAQKIIDDEATSAEQKRDAFDDLVNLKKNETKLTKDGQAAQLKADAAMLGSAKKLFNEKSVAHKVLGGIEKAMHIASLAMEAEKVAVAIAGMAERIPAYAAEIYGATIGQLGPIAGPIVATALVATLVAMAAAAGGGGGGGVSMPAPPSYEQLQEVQGTGQDYQAGTTTLISNNGGVLGDIKAKSEDIANSIDYIESHTFETLVYNNKMLAALKGIEVNTSEFVASLAQAGIIGINSPFGTQNTSSGGGSPGFFGIGGSSSSTSREVTDFGVKITGALGSLLKGVGDYLVYETVKTVSSWSKSGFMGIGGGSGTSTSYNTEFRNLNDDVITTLRALFVNASDFILASGEVLGGRTQTELQNIIDRTEIKLDVSTFNMTGEQALSDIMAEIGVEMNKVVQVAYPFLTEFQKLGEGLATTLTRVTNDMQSVDVMFAQMGIDFTDKFLNNITEKTKKVWQQVAMEGESVQLAPGTQVKYGIGTTFATGTVDASGIISFINQVFGDPVYGVVKEGYALVDKVVTVAEQKLALYEDLINKFGGDLQTFVDKTQFYIDNFIDANTVLMAHYDAVGKELNRLQGIYPNVALSTVDTRQEFITLVNSLDLASETGRQLYADLMNLAPGFDVIAKHLEDLISSAKLSADDFVSILNDALTGNLAASSVGEKIANTVYDGVMATISSSYVKNIGSLMVDYLVTPIISAAAAGQSIVGVVTTQTMQNVRNIAVASAQMLSAVFSDTEFLNALNTMSQQIGAAVTSFTELATGTDQAAASAKALTELLSRSSLAASNFSSILKDALLGNIAISDIGTKVADLINNGILTAITDSYVTNISNAITDTIITPLVKAATTGAVISTAVSEASMDSIRIAATNAAAAIAQIYSDPAFLLTINQTITTITDSMKLLASTTQITAGSISKILSKSNAKVIDAYKRQASELTATINKLKGFSESLKDFQKSLLTGASSPLTPLQKYQTALDELNKTYAAATSTGTSPAEVAAREAAINNLKTVAQTFLDVSADYYASSDAYVKDFNRVQEILTNTISSVDTQVSIYEQQLDTANEQLKKLGYIDETAKSIEQLLKEAQDIQKQEVANVLSGGFVQLDKNLDGLLNIDELKAANLASDSELAKVYEMLDSNGDGQISALEALQSSAEGTIYSINSLAPILVGIQNGTISVEQAIQYLAKINEANLGVGGSAIGVDFTKYLPGGSSGPGTTGGGTGYDGILNQVYNELGLTKDASGMAYWSKQLLEGKVTTETLLQSVLNAALGNNDPNAVKWVTDYVEGAYQKVLGREGEAGGINYWVSSIKAGNVKINDLYQTFSKSEEAINKGVTNLDDYITRAYEVVLGRRPDPAGLAAWKSQIETGQMYIGDLYAAFRSSSEYINLIRDQIFGMGSNINNNTVTGSQGVPGFASGGYHMGGIRLVGELGPELEATGQARIWTAAQTRNMLAGITSRDNYNGELIAEIQKLNKKIEKLEQTVQQGDIMNAEATERNTREVSNTVKDSSSKATYTNKLQTRAAIV